MMYPFGRGDLGGIDNEALDFSQLEEYINDDAENNIYFHDALVSQDLKLHDQEKEVTYVSSSRKDSLITADQHGADPLSQAVSSICVTSPDSAPLTKSCVLNRPRNVVLTSSGFTKPHHLPDSPPDSGSEPPFSPPNEDPKLRCPSAGSLEMLHHHHHHQGELKQYMTYTHAMSSKNDAISSSTSPPATTAPTLHHNPSHHHHHPQQHHQHHQSPIPVSPITVHSSLSSSMPILSTSSTNALTSQLMGQVPPGISSFAGNALQQQLLAPPGTHLGHLYAGEEFVYENLSSPVTSTTTSKKRKLPESPKNSRNGNVQVKTEPVLASPDPSQGSVVAPSSEEEYSFDLSSADPSSLFVDSSYQCIRFQPFQPSTWAQLMDKDMKEIPCPNFRVDADKGFNFSNADESFVCQKKNHFQVTVHVQPLAHAHYVRTPDGQPKTLEKFSLHFHGVKMESPSQTIKVEQSQSDRSKRPFHPVPLELSPDQVTKTTVGRLHFSETTSNNMRKKGKPNPDQRFFFLVVGLSAYLPGEDTPLTVVAHASEKIIVRASNPGQFENDMELSWQKGQTLDSIFHNGRVGINTDRPEESLVVHGNIKVTGHILQPSDIRAKYDIQELDTRQQLENVSKLRIVRYKYLPAFAERLGTDCAADTGVIAQEVRSLIPEAVVEAGDVSLEDGQLVEKLLVVNKERLFMENVGAVKELCKVTDNLETRIDELERINRKLTSIKHKDSLKSNSTDNSRSSSLRGRKPSSPTWNKQHRSNPEAACSRHFIQSSIAILVFIMAFCVIALITLYSLEYNRQYVIFPRHVTVVQQLSSTLPKNATISDITKNLPTPKSTPTSFSQRKSTASDLRKESTLKHRSNTMIPEGRDREDLFNTDATPCQADECPVDCCDAYVDDEDVSDTPDLERRIREDHTVLNSREVFSDDEGDSKLRSSAISSATEDWRLPSTSRDTQNVLERIKRSASIFTTREATEHRQKRMVTSDDEIAEGRDDQIRDLSAIDSIFRVPELHTVISSENCTELRTDASRITQYLCLVEISRNFALRNITLIFRNEERDMMVAICSRKSRPCHREAPMDDELKSNGIAKRETVSQSASWKLPVGAHIKSQYTFRTKERDGLISDNQLCELPGNQYQITEYTLRFERRCDK